MCAPAPSDERTHWGNENIVLSTVTRVRMLGGTITDASASPISNALIEVLTDPDVQALPYSPKREARRAKQRRVAACLTKTDGRFCLTGIPAGRYELRFSAQGFQTVSQTIRVVVKGRARRHMLARLTVAT
jgi:protocatechuate 3,4-dioxygenase beta subunit